VDWQDKLIPVIRPTPTKQTAAPRRKAATKIKNKGPRGLKHTSSSISAPEEKPRSKKRLAIPNKEKKGPLTVLQTLSSRLGRLEKITKQQAEVNNLLVQVLYMLDDPPIHRFFPSL
jgi:hypothetical protein